VESEGSSNRVCLRNMVDYLVNEKWYNERMNDAEDEAERIIMTAAKLILQDIRSKTYDSEFYPTKDTIACVEKE